MASEMRLHCPTRIVFGSGALGELRSYTKALLVTGQRATKRSGLSDRLGPILNQCTWFNGVPPEPTTIVVEAIVRLIRQHDITTIVAVGGGSVMDAAKMAAAVATWGGQCGDYEFGDLPSALSSYHLVCIPTTAGSGSEVTPYAVITNSTTGRKWTRAHDALFPDLAIIDPDLTHTCSPAVTLASGLDAWSHGLEAYLSKQASHLADPWALEVMSTVQEFLPRALANPDDELARQLLGRAAMLGGLCIAHVRTGLIHTLSVALAPHVKVAHGLLNAIIAPHALDFNGVHPSDPRGSLVQTFLDAVGVPHQLEADRSIIPAVVERVMQDQGLADVNPRPYTADDIQGIVEGLLT